MNILICVATHKPYWMPNDDIYLPLQVGAAFNANKFLPNTDSTGINISGKNKNYCELTGLYWVWKNISYKYDYIGLVHYRRHFASKTIGNKKNRVIDSKHLEELLDKYDVLLPRKRHYYIESNCSQYIHAHHKEDLDLTRSIIKGKYLEYLDTYDKELSKTSGHKFNMFVMKKDIFNGYCAWLFDILFELENRLDISNYSSYDSRVFGFVSELLLDVYINKNNIKYKDIPYVYLEKVNWINKIVNFLKRKMKSHDK